MSKKGWRSLNAWGRAIGKKQGALKKTSGRSLFSRTPRCAPLRLLLIVHLPCQPQSSETKETWRKFPGSNCQVAGKFYLRPYFGD
jgi:hypothetical protein